MNRNFYFIPLITQQASRHYRDACSNKSTPIYFFVRSVFFFSSPLPSALLPLSIGLKTPWGLYKVCSASGSFAEHACLWKHFGA
jgi:hypothetical protein